MIPTHYVLRYETRLAMAPGPSPATKPPLSGLRRPSASSAPSPTFAHGPRGRQASTPWASGTPCRPVGQRGVPGPPGAAKAIGTTWPPSGAIAAHRDTDRVEFRLGRVSAWALCAPGDEGERARLAMLLNAKEGGSDAR